MKVFKMNDIDHVCAKTEEQAKQYYKELTGEDELGINEEFEGEVSLQNTMLIDTDDLPVEEQKMVQEMRIIGGHCYAYKTFEWVIEQDKPTEPYIICTTEW